LNKANHCFDCSFLGLVGVFLDQETYSLIFVDGFVSTVYTFVEYEFVSIIDFNIEGMTFEAEGTQKLCEFPIHINHNDTRH